jgi:outer membrane protein TolC
MAKKSYKLGVIFSMCLTLGIIATESVLAQDKKAFTLESAQQYAIKNSIQNKLTAKEIESAKESVNFLLGAAYPQISAEGGFQHFLDIPVQLAPADAFAFPDWMNQTLAASAMQQGIAIPAPSGGDEFSEFQFGTKFNLNAGITVNQALVDGAVLLGIKAAKGALELMDMTMEKTDKEVKDLVAMSYVSALIAQENITLLDENIKNLSSTLKESRAINAEGFLDELQIDQLELSMQNLESQFNLAKNRVDLAKTLLKFQMNYPLEDPITLEDKLDKFITESTSSGSLLTNNLAVNNHINYRLLDKQEYLLGLNTKVEKSQGLPKLYGFFNHQQNSFQNDFGKVGDKWFPTTLWGLKLQIPIFAGFMQNANVAKAKIEVEKVQLQKELTSKALTLEAKQAKIEFESALEQYNQQKSSVELAKKIKNKTDIKFKEGMTSSLELTQVQSQLLAAQGAFLNATYQLINSKLKLESILK